MASPGTPRGCGTAGILCNLFAMFPGSPLAGRRGRDPPPPADTTPQPRPGTVADTALTILMKTQRCLF